MRSLCFTLIAFVLTGCISSPTETGLYTPEELKPLQTGIDLYTTEDLRPLHIEIKTSNQDLKFTYNNYGNAGLPENKRFSQSISTGDFSGEISVPKGQNIYISADNYDQVKFYITGSSFVAPTQNNVKLNFEVKSVNTKLRDIINSLTDEQKSDLRRIVGTYNEAISSPLILINTLHHKAETQLSIFFRETNTRGTFLQKYLSAMNQKLEFAMIPTKFGRGVDRDYLRESELMLSQVSLIIDNS